MPAHKKRFWTISRRIWLVLFVAATIPAWGDWRVWLRRSPPDFVPLSTVPAEYSEQELADIEKDVADAWREFKKQLRIYHGDRFTPDPPATEVEIQAAENMIGMRFPPHYRASLKIHSGFPETKRPYYWVPVSLPDSVMFYRDRMRAHRNNLHRHYHPNFHLAEWSPRLFRVSGWNMRHSRAGHVVDLETGMVHWCTKTIDPRADNFADYLRSCATYMNR